MRDLEAAGHGYGISADLSRELAAAIRALPETAWHIECEDSAATRHWAEVAYVPSDGVTTRDRPAPPRYLAQGRLFAAMRGCGVPAPHSQGGEVKHFAIVTNLPDPEGGSGLDLIRWQRGKAGTVEHSHHVLTNELAAEALPSQRFAANAAWFRLNVMLHNLLSAFKRVALPEELHAARPKRLRFMQAETLAQRLMELEVDALDAGPRGCAPVGSVGVAVAVGSQAERSQGAVHHVSARSSGRQADPDHRRRHRARARHGPAVPRAGRRARDLRAA